MLKKRLIFTLLLDNGEFQLSRNFSLQRVGNIDWLFNSYHAEAILHSIDELIVLNVSKKENSFDLFISTLEKLSKKCFMPISAGGGIRELEQVKQIFHAGADKVILNTALFQDTDLIMNISKIYGRQSVVASVDYRLSNEEPVIYRDHGKQSLDMNFESFFERLSNMSIGELYLTSIDQDGTGRGYDIVTLNKIKDLVRVPIIASGGVGKFEHLYEGMLIDRVTGVSTANLFNFIGNGLQLAREYLCKTEAPMATWNYNSLMPMQG